MGTHVHRVLHKNWFLPEVLAQGKEKKEKQQNKDLPRPNFLRETCHRMKMLRNVILNHLAQRLRGVVPRCTDGRVSVCCVLSLVITVGRWQTPLTMPNLLVLLLWAFFTTTHA